MFKRNHHVTTVIRAIHSTGERTKIFDLSDPDDWDLPPFEPGAHIDVHVQEQVVRQYSICGDPLDRKHYKIAVQHDSAGRGGSDLIYRTFAAGQEVSVSLPRNHFVLVPGGNHYILIAGGIGITPFIPMIATLQRNGSSFELHYCTRTAADTPFIEHLAEPAIGGRVTFYHSRDTVGERLNIDGLIVEAKPQSHIYCCGPERMIEAVLATTTSLPAEFVHVERFGAAARSSHGRADYKVKLARSGQVIDVQPGQSMLSAIREAGVEIEASCEGGVCLSCKTRYLGGTPSHRDLLLKEDERKQYLTPCVSHSLTDLLVLDL